MRNAADRLPWIMMCAAETSDSERSGASAGQWRTAEASDPPVAAVALVAPPACKGIDFRVWVPL
jgi:hypothetical protein